MAEPANVQVDTTDAEQRVLTILRKRLADQRRAKTTGKLVLEIGLMNGGVTSKQVSVQEKVD